MFDSDLNKLVQDTLNENKKENPNYIKRNPFDTDLPKGPGVVYALSKSLGTISIQSIPTKSIAENYEKICQELIEYEDIMHFETDYYELAEVITDQYKGKRLPINETRIFNISDPSYSWWLQYDEKSLKLYFKSFGLDNEENVVNLGPISDSLIATMRLKQAKPLFREMFPVSEFSLNERHFYIETNIAGHENFEILKNLFIKGRGANKIYYAVKGKIDRTLYYYLKEIEAVRRFWLHIESAIADDINA